MTLCDAVIHVNETLDEQAMNFLTEIECSSHGVFSAKFGARTPHLMMVSYAPQMTNAKSVLGVVRGQGYHAQLAGGS
ncbi:MAG: hypothetical protein Q8Q28_04475 [Pseudomonadota bacterium]|nr:hypothetical protein [Pseudomonadota bacterium]